jgi:pimeloyl-ACP methyl ester carboxylesterase
MNYKYNLHFLPPKQINRERPLLIYIPGMDGTGSLFQFQADSLAADFDLRCLSIPIRNTEGWLNLAAETAELIKSELAYNRERLVYVCGESFGGCLALKTALTAPSLIQRLILVNPASSFNQNPIFSLGANAMNLIPNWVYAYSTLGFLPFLAQLDRIEYRYSHALLKAMQTLPPQLVSHRLSLLQNFQVSNTELKNLKIITLLIAGGSDRLLPSVAEAKRLISLLPKAKMMVLPHSGHACLLETETNLYNILAEQGFLIK